MKISTIDFILNDSYDSISQSEQSEAGKRKVLGFEGSTRIPSEDCNEKLKASLSQRRTSIAVSRQKSDQKAESSEELFSTPLVFPHEVRVFPLHHLMFEPKYRTKSNHLVHVELVKPVQPQNDQEPTPEPAWSKSEVQTKNLGIITLRPSIPVFELDPFSDEGGRNVGETLDSVIREGDEMEPHLGHKRVNIDTNLDLSGYFKNNKDYMNFKADKAKKTAPNTLELSRPTKLKGFLSEPTAYRHIEAAKTHHLRSQ